MDGIVFVQLPCSHPLFTVTLTTPLKGGDGRGNAVAYLYRSEVGIVVVNLRHYLDYLGLLHFLFWRVE